MDRWIRFSAAGAHLCWRVKNGRQEAWAFLLVHNMVATVAARAAALAGIDPDAISFTAPDADLPRVGDRRRGPGLGSASSWPGAQCPRSVTAS